MSEKEQLNKDLNELLSLLTNASNPNEAIKTAYEIIKGEQKK